MKVYKVEVMVVDHDEIGEDGIKTALATASFSNRCMRPQFVRAESREIEWDDRHPLNMRVGWREAFLAMFGSDAVAQAKAWLASTDPSDAIEAANYFAEAIIAMSEGR